MFASQHQIFLELTIVWPPFLDLLSAVQEQEKWFKTLLQRYMILNIISKQSASVDKWFHSEVMVISILFGAAYESGL